MSHASDSPPSVPPSHPASSRASDGGMALDPGPPAPADGGVEPAVETSAEVARQVDDIKRRALLRLTMASSRSMPTAANPTYTPAEYAHKYRGGDANPLPTPDVWSGHHRTPHPAVGIASPAALRVAAGLPPKGREIPLPPEPAFHPAQMSPARYFDPGMEYFHTTPAAQIATGGAKTPFTQQAIPNYATQRQLYGSSNDRVSPRNQGLVDTPRGYHNQYAHATPASHGNNSTVRWKRVVDRSREGHELVESVRWVREELLL